MGPSVERDKKLDALIGEAGGAGTAAAAGATEPATDKLTPEELTGLATFAVSTVGDVICHRCGVKTLTSDEVAKISTPVGKLIAAYDLATLDPKSAAWIGLGVATFGIAAPRVMYLQRQRAERAARPPELADPITVDPPAAPVAEPTPSSNSAQGVDAKDLFKKETKPPVH